eukprot:469615-Rhodomonas_salina.1
MQRLLGEDGACTACVWVPWDAQLAASRWCREAKGTWTSSATTSSPLRKRRESAGGASAATSTSSTSTCLLVRSNNACAREDIASVRRREGRRQGGRGAYASLVLGSEDSDGGQGEGEHAEGGADP